MLTVHPQERSPMCTIQPSAQCYCMVLKPYIVTNMSWNSTVHSKFVNASLGLKSYSRNTPLLHVMKIDRVRKSVHTQELNLFKTMFLFSSRSYNFYQFLFAQHVNG